MSEDTFIAVEWGVGSLRARLLTESGGIVDAINEDIRLADTSHEDRVECLRAWRDRWPGAAETIWLAGMIGSSLGLASVAQLPCPATPEDIARHASRITVDGIPVAILPGLSCISRFGDFDVLRGEEVAATGLIDPERQGRATLLSVPGMHGKWIDLNETRIESFHTSMTAELHHAMTKQSILAPLMSAPPGDGAAFRHGLSRGAEGSGVARLLFTARTAVLQGTLSEEEAASYIWGVLIGSDVRENLDRGEDSPRAFFVTGAETVAPLFAAALNTLGVKAELVDNRRLSAAGFARLRNTEKRQERPV